MSDRFCASVHGPCSFPAQFEAFAPTVTSNRVCTTTTVCILGQNQVADATTTSNRVCKTCASGTEDADSDSLTPCTACLPGTSDVDSDAATACVRCDPGTNVTSSGATGPCPACPAGYTDHDSNPSTACLVGLPLCSLLFFSSFFSKKKMTEKNNPIICSCARVATSWPKVRRDSAIRAALEQQMTIQMRPQCARYFFRPFVFKKIKLNKNLISNFPLFSRLVKQPCGEGTVALLGSYGACELCAAGFTDDDRSAATPCIPCSAPGLFVPLGSFGTCSSKICPVGTIDVDGLASTACISCIGSTRGLYVPPGTSKANCTDFACRPGTASVLASTPCQACSSGYFASSAGTKQCSACTVCPKGNFFESVQSFSCCVPAVVFFSY